MKSASFLQGLHCTCEKDKGEDSGRTELNTYYVPGGYLSERGIEASLELKFQKVIESKVRWCNTLVRVDPKQTGFNPFPRAAFGTFAK